MRNRTEDQMTFLCIRHGATQANEQHRYLGRTDESLSQNGRKTLLSYKEQNYYPDTERLFVSPMKRCLETAEILYPGITPVIIPEWREMDFGRFEYQSYKDLEHDAAYQAWIDSGGTRPFPEGESREAFTMRCEKGLQRMCREICKNAAKAAVPKAHADIAAIVHGGTIMALLSLHDRNSYFTYQVPNGRGYLCGIQICGGYAQIRKAVKL